MQISTQDYLFLQFGRLVISLDDVCAVYFPQLKRTQITRKAGEQGFPFPCFRLVDSQKAPYFVHVSELAKAFDKARTTVNSDHAKLHA
ncbi:hypothetical protein MOMA_00055 [Moraxella macacae 0408225]|uniref:Pyocin activator protein PrtN n=1 Tax=Moraxella macacae 0408225 TaxID=1230338 RepID=L2F6Q3_9GAMM|nr:pyocin activator PrtN family protein [Moraxella macacae]ELA08759.1 hypothetical protein MOMA_00055 [Moraxella macacae 0408225]